jgi:hypothetical protein
MSVLATFGGTGTAPSQRRDEYGQFDDGPMYPLKTMVNVEARADDGQKAGAAWPHTRQGSFNSQDDSNSEKAIVQTRTTTVAYSN